MKTSFFTHSIGRHNKKNTTSILVSGFTLIELMVATTIFSIIMVMGVGSLVATSNAAKAAHRQRIAVDNVNFAMESITRELRLGTHFKYGTTSVNVGEESVGDGSGGAITFTPQQVEGAPQRVAYIWQQDGKIQRVSTGGNYYDVTSSEVNIQGVIFVVKGSALNDKIQPSVKILIKGVVNVGVGTPFTLQSIASQRSAE